MITETEMAIASYLVLVGPSLIVGTVACLLYTDYAGQKEIGSLAPWTIMGFATGFLTGPIGGFLTYNTMCKALERGRRPLAWGMSSLIPAVPIIGTVAFFSVASPWVGMVVGVVWMLLVLAVASCADPI